MSSSSNINWGSVADWVSGIGSLSAAAVALYVSRFSQRIRLRGYSGHRLIIGTGQPQIEVFTVSATNISQRPTIITNIGFSCGVWKWKRQGIIAFMQDDISHGIPKTLADGETGSWYVRLGPENEWAKELVKKFEMTPFLVKTLRIHIHTSNGGTTTLRPEVNFREILVSFIKKESNGVKPTLFSK